jgi:hypothetical protein
LNSSSTGTNRGIWLSSLIPVLFAPEPEFFPVRRHIFGRGIVLLNGYQRTAACLYLVSLGFFISILVSNARVTINYLGK